ncbi:ATP-binding protein [uncultured Eubacterium sp.]|uniref:ATP-binding protein n=1 Tax=uncultured Eubacterium sp. TaxID=165185 RepID=UPI002599F81A|nr:ATP-binding protein [uncultured Eubacterium sp.]
MERKIMEDLCSWKNKKSRKPLILQGARQVGKTWIMKEFGKRYYKNVAYINLDENEQMKKSFAVDFDVKRIIEDITIVSGEKIEPEETLIIIDEVQESPKAITALKYFCENASEYHIIVAGSFLGVAMHKGISYPVGKVNILTMYPLSYYEFLLACGEDDLAKYVNKAENNKNQVFREKYIRYLKLYYYVGGMPEAVSCYVDDKDINEVRNIQKEIVSLYEKDFSKHIDNKSELERTRMVWDSIPLQLAKENKKFFFGQIKKGARSAQYEVSIQWLIDCGLCYKVHMVSKPAMPLKSYKEPQAYKLFMIDVGLLGAMSDLDINSILGDDELFVEFKGALTEQYVLQQIISTTEMVPYYYSNTNSRNEIDFLMQIKSDIVPIEVKAEENLKSKSLKAYIDKYDPKYAIRFSMKDYIKQEVIINIPLWNISAIGEI